MNFVGLGHSHIVALAEGTYALQARGFAIAGQPISARFHYLYDIGFVPPFSKEADAVTLNPLIAEALNAEAYQFVIACVGGNEHNALAMMQVGPKYDFIPRQNPAAAVDLDAQIVPEMAIRETLREAISDKIALLSLIRTATDRPIVLVPPPPPLPSEQVIKFREEFFSSRVDLRKLNSDRIRQKMWLTQVSLIEEVSAELEMSFAVPFEDAMDKEGMLARSFWGQDASHANALYGQCQIERVLGQIEDIL